MILATTTASNILSFDVEEWFQVANFMGHIPRSEWDAYESRVEIGVDFILETLAARKILANFFVVGWVAKRHRAMVERICLQGHEVGIHGYYHENVTDQDPKTFSKDIQRSIEVVSSITGKQVRGYRAPTYTITPRTVWALDILREQGIEYDSSLYPIKGHPSYGFPGSPTTPFQFENGLVEFPMSSFQIGGLSLPFGSGGYFRLLPFSLTKCIGKRINRKGIGFTVNIHPWELDAEHEILPAIPFVDRFRHCVNLSSNRTKFNRLIETFTFTTFAEYIKSHTLSTARVRDGQIQFS